MLVGCAGRLNGRPQPAVTIAILRRSLQADSGKGSRRIPLPPAEPSGLVRDQRRLTGIAGSRRERTKRRAGGMRAVT